MPEGLHVAAAVRAADVVVVISGTDGALPAVVAGLVESPVIAVPTSVGYGAALQVSQVHALPTRPSSGVPLVQLLDPAVLCWCTGHSKVVCWNQ